MSAPTTPPAGRVLLPSAVTRVTEVDGGILRMAEAALVVLGVVLIRLPAIGGDGGIGRVLMILTLLPFFAVATARLVLAPAFSAAGRAALQTLRASVRERESGAFFVVLAAYLFLVVAALLRGIGSGRMSASMAIYQSVLWLTMAAFGAGALLTRREGNRSRVAPMVVAGLVTFMLVNLILRSLGVDTPESVTLVSLVREPSTLAGMFGVVLERAGFPLGNGLNGFGVSAGMTAFASIILLVSRESDFWERALGAAGIVLGTACLVAVDSRMALALLLFVTPLILLWPRHRLAALSWFSVASLVLPFIAIGLSLALAAKDVSWLPVRSDADLFTLNNRTIIWGTVALELQNPAAGHLLGYGYEGPQASGVIYRAGDFVGRMFDMEHVTVHNAPLQHVLDVGYVGLILFVVLFWLAIRLASAPGRRARDQRLLVGLLLFIILSGVTESVPSIASSDVMLVMLWVAIAAAAPLVPRRGETATSAAATVEFSRG